MASGSFHPLFTREEKGAEAGLENRAEARLEQTLGPWAHNRNTK